MLQKNFKGMPVEIVLNFKFLIYNIQYFRQIFEFSNKKIKIPFITKCFNESNCIIMTRSLKLKYKILKKSGSISYAYRM